MPDAADLLHSLREKGFTLWAERDRAGEWRPMLNPAGKLTDADRQELFRHREAILELLQFEIDSYAASRPGPGYFWRPPRPTEGWNDGAGPVF